MKPPAPQGATAAPEPSATAPTDLTAAARIRNAAISRFARDGFTTGLRTIAADAGVTAGLITHHFRTKAGLRAACDAEVLRLTVQAKRDSAVLGGPMDVLTQMAHIEDYVPAAAYAMRSLSEGGPLASALLDSFVADAVAYMADGVAAGALTPSDDEPSRARYLTYAGFGAMILFARYEATDPTDIEAVTREFISRYGPAVAEIYSRPLINDPDLYATYLAATRNPQEHP